MRYSPSQPSPALNGLSASRLIYHGMPSLSLHARSSSYRRGIMVPESPFLGHGIRLPELPFFHVYGHLPVFPEDSEDRFGFFQASKFCFLGGLSVCDVLGDQGVPADRELPPVLSCLVALVVDWKHGR